MPYTPDPHRAWRRPVCRIKDASRRYAVPAKRRASLTRQPVRHPRNMQGRDEEQGYQSEQGTGH
jgi:hypothetical protein